MYVGMKIRPLLSQLRNRHCMESCPELAFLK